MTPSDQICLCSLSLSLLHLCETPCHRPFSFLLLFTLISSCVLVLLELHVVKASHGAWPPNWATHYSSVQSLQEVRGTGHREGLNTPPLPFLCIGFTLIPVPWLRCLLNTASHKFQTRSNCFEKLVLICKFSQCCCGSNVHLQLPYQHKNSLSAHSYSHTDPGVGYTAPQM